MRLTIGKIANQAGVNTDTLRYYEREGIIAKPVRNGSNYRVYSDDTVLRVRFVKRAQELGFSLAEIKELLELRISEEARCGNVRDQALAKIEDPMARFLRCERCAAGSRSSSLDARERVR